MVEETIFQHWIVTQFILPFLLIWTIVFAILQKTKLLGDDKKQLDAIVAFVIGLIFVGAIFPKLVVSNLILFLTVAIIIVFVGLLLWGFVSGGSLKENFISNTAVKWIIGIVLVIIVIIAVFWATGSSNEVIDFLFKQDWSNSLWLNVAFIVVIAGAIALVLKGKSD